MATKAVNCNLDKDGMRRMDASQRDGTVHSVQRYGSFVWMTKTRKGVVSKGRGERRGSDGAGWGE